MDRRLLFQDWMIVQPYDQPNPSDYYYFGICKKVIAALESRHQNRDYDIFNENDVIEVAVIITSYFQDIISETYIWPTFTAEHNALYNKFLPFYELDDLYIEEEINVEDIQFLIWYYITYIKESYLSPHASLIKEIASEIIELLEDNYETAPTNEALVEFLSLDHNDDNFYSIKQKMEWLSMRSYLFSIRSEAYYEEMDELEDIKDPNDQLVDFVSEETYDLYIIDTPLPLMALRANEYYAKLLSATHPLYNAILNMGLKKTGYYLYKNHDKAFLYLQHIASDKTVAVTLKSITPSNDLVPNESIFYISLVKFNGEYWLSGPYYSIPFNADLILDEKKNVQSKRLFVDPQNIPALEKEYNAFLEFNGNKPLAYFSKGSETIQFIKNWVSYLNEKKIKSQPVDELITSDFESSISKGVEQTPSVIYYNQQRGIELAFGINGLILENDNPNRGITQEGIIRLLFSNDISTQLARYISEKYRWNKENFNEKEDFIYIQEELDFLLRMFKSDDYTVND